MLKRSLHAVAGLLFLSAFAFVAKAEPVEHGISAALDAMQAASTSDVAPSAVSNHEAPMSYSFSVKAKTKPLLLAAVNEQLDNVLVHQPNHAADIAVAKTSAEALVCTLRDPAEDETLNATCHGLVSWNGVDQAVFSAVNFSFSSTITKDA